MPALPEDGLALTLLADVRASGLLGTRPIALTLLRPPYPVLGVGALRVLRVQRTARRDDRRRRVVRALRAHRKGPRLMRNLRVAPPAPVLDPRRLPRHVAIIMDGNRRWARARRLPAIEGHRRGIIALRKVTHAARDLGIPILTVYGFSTENWGRDGLEISLLLDLCVYFAKSELAELQRNNVRVNVIGRYRALPRASREALESLAVQTAGNDGLLLNLAVNYSGRTEFADAAAALARRRRGRPARARRDRRAPRRVVSPHRRSARSRSVDPARRRGALVQLPALSTGPRRAPRQRCVLAGLLVRAPGACGRGLPGAGDASGAVTAAPSHATRARDLNRRVATGIVLAGLGFGCVLYAPLFALLVLAIALGCLWELDRLSARKGQELVFPVAAAAVTAFIVLGRVRSAASSTSASS